MAKKFYDKIKVDRDWYFVEYFPPTPKSLFAGVTLVVYDQTNKTVEDIANAMEEEAKSWVEKYPIPVFVGAVDKSELNLSLDGHRPINNAVAFRDEKSGIVQVYWEVLKNDQIPKLALDETYKDQVYNGLSYRSDADINDLNKSRRIAKRKSVILLVLWLSVIPAAIAILGWANPIFSAIALLYSLYKATDKFLIVTGKKKQSKKGKKKQEKQMQMEHYYYHCSRNPEGFRKLKQENFENEAQHKVLSEVRELKEKDS